jgi:hypothetical protein
VCFLAEPVVEHSEERAAAGALLVEVLCDVTVGASS